MRSKYLQYFCGFERYQHTAAFAPTLFVTLRKRLSPDRFAAFEQAIIDRVEQTRRPATDSVPDDLNDPPTPSGQAAAPSAGDSTLDIPAPRGPLVIDASVAEQGIRYPADVGLLNDARESAEAMVDELWQALTRDGWVSGRKPRTYRQRARADYLAHSKKRRATARGASSAAAVSAAGSGAYRSAAGCLGDPPTRRPLPAALSSSAPAMGDPGSRGVTLVSGV